jgi:hypothetical protein
MSRSESISDRNIQQLASGVRVTLGTISVQLVFPQNLRTTSECKQR